MMDPNGAARESEAAPFHSMCSSSLADGDEKVVFFKKNIILLSFYWLPKL